MHRSELLALLDRHSTRFNVESGYISRTRAFLERHPDCFNRELHEGHVTGSAWVVNPARDKALLMHHRKHNEWFQPGGHADGDADILRVAWGAMTSFVDETGVELLFGCSSFYGVDAEEYADGHLAGAVAGFTLLEMYLAECPESEAVRAVARAEGLAEQAERELENNRYDADLPRSLAREAAYEARHAIYLSGYVRALRDRNASEEEIILEWEQPLREVAAAADLVAGFDDGFAAPTAAVKDFIEALRAENREADENFAAERAKLEADPNVQALKDMFDAELKPESIKLNNPSQD